MATFIKLCINNASCCSVCFNSRTIKTNTNLFTMIRVFLLSFVVLFYGCRTKSSFEIVPLKETRNKHLTNLQVITQLINLNFDKEERVFVIEDFSPMFHTAVFFSVQDREKSFRLNLANKQVCKTSEGQIKVLNKIDIDEFTKMIRSTNGDTNYISSMTIYGCYYFQEHSLLYKEHNSVNKMNAKLIDAQKMRELYKLMSTQCDR
jgi:hypothetical protein